MTRSSDRFSRVQTLESDVYELRFFDFAGCFDVNKMFINTLNRMADAFEAPVETRTEEKEYEENSRPFHKKGKEKETEPEKTTRPNGVNVFERGTVVCVSAADMASFRDEEDKWHVDVGKVWERIQKKWVGPATLAGASENVRVVFPKSQHCLPIVRP